MGQGSQRSAVFRRFCVIVAFGTFACASLTAQTQTSVPGMSRFTEADFGFSFWYPAAWNVMDEPVPNPPSNGWFRDATIVKVFKIRNPAAALDQKQPPGVILQELSAPGGLTELGTESASPVGVDQKYFFDNDTHRWMYARLSEAPDGASPATSPAKILRRTVGGLPIFWGAARGGAGVIVPLDDSHFLTIGTLDAGGDDIHIYLAATVVATRSGEGQHASEEMQFNTIRAEGVKLGAIGKPLEPLGFWYKDSQHVYKFNGEVLRRANPKTFAPLSRNSPGDNFATDGVRVYRAYSDGAIPGADPKTFVATGQFTAKDARHTYNWTSGHLKIDSITARQR